MATSASRLQPELHVWLADRDNRGRLEARHRPWL